MSKITTISDIEKLKYALDSVFDEIPNNIYIECPELFSYGKEQLGLNDKEDKRMKNAMSKTRMKSSKGNYHRYKRRKPNKRFI